MLVRKNECKLFARGSDLSHWCRWGGRIPPLLYCQFLQFVREGLGHGLDLFRRHLSAQFAGEADAFADEHGLEGDLGCGQQGDASAQGGYPVVLRRVVGGLKFVERMPARVGFLEAVGRRIHRQIP